MWNLNKGKTAKGVSPAAAGSAARASEVTATSAPSSQTGGTPAIDYSTIGKLITIKGEVSGSELLLIEGRVEGTISFPESRVTIGRTANVAANVTAREIVVLGTVRGNLNGTDRVDVRNQGSVTGDVVAQRINMEDGAFFQGRIDVRDPRQSATEPVDGMVITSC